MPPCSQGFPRARFEISSRLSSGRLDLGVFRVQGKHFQRNFADTPDISCISVGPDKKAYRPKNFMRIRTPAPEPRQSGPKCLSPPAHAPKDPPNPKIAPKFPIPHLHLLRRRLARPHSAGAGRRRPCADCRAPTQLGLLLLAFIP